jgi:3-methylcrotonyl-CoA carboxylase alpha subunit/geranyl-CoA carboxylase alpha subunit
MRRSAVRVTASVRPAQTDLHLWDEYGESDAHVSVGRDRTTVEINGATIELGTLVIDGRRAIAPGLDHDGFIVERDTEVIYVASRGVALAAKVALKIDLPRARTNHDRERNVIEAPLHGVVSSINVAVGDSVGKGDPLIQMEAMKLVHTLAAPVSGIVFAILCAPGETAPAGAILMEITPAEAKEAV